MWGGWGKYIPYGTSEGTSCWLWELGEGVGGSSIGFGVGAGTGTSCGYNDSKLGAGAGLVLGRHNSIAYLGQCCHWAVLPCPSPFPQLVARFLGL